VFYDKEYRVEKWDIPTQKRASIHQISLPMRCLQTTLSPTGNALACMTNEFELQIVDVEKNSIQFSRKKFYQPNEFEAYFFELMIMLGSPAEFFHMQFSPDGHYFLVGRARTALGYDLTAHEEIKLPRKIKDLAGGTFTFLTPDELAGINPQPTRYIVRVRFPLGDPIDEFPALNSGEIAGVSKGDYMLIRGGSAPVGVLDLKTRKAIFGYKSPGFDIYDQWFAGEAVGGEVGIFNMGDKKAVSQIHLPDSPLGRPRAVAFSSNGKWLATSGPTRGAIWNLETGERMFYTLGFDGAFFDQDRFIAKFPRHENNPSRVFQFDPTDKSTKFLYSMSEDPSESPTKQTFPDAFTWQLGELLLTLGPGSDKSRSDHLLMRVYDVRTKNKLWERPIRKTRPEFFPSRPGKTLTMLVADYASIKAEAKEDASLNARLQAIEGTEGKKDSYVLRVFDSLSGKDLGAVLVDTNNLSFRVIWATTILDTVLVGDSINRTLVYSLKSGTQKGKIFGSPRAISNDGTKMLVEGNAGTADLYDIATLASVAHFTFSSRIIHAEFTADGNAVLVLTADQTVYRLKTGASQEGSRTADAATTAK
jgi:WD40 repeat protein